MDLAGVTAQGDRDGRSLVPVLEGEAEDWRSSFLIEYFSDTDYVTEAWQPSTFRKVRFSEWHLAGGLDPAGGAPASMAADKKSQPPSARTTFRPAGRRRSSPGASGGAHRGSR